MRYPMSRKIQGTSSRHGGEVFMSLHSCYFCKGRQLPKHDAPAEVYLPAEAFTDLSALIYQIATQAFNS